MEHRSPCSEEQYRAIIEAFLNSGMHNYELHPIEVTEFENQKTQG